MSQLPLIAHQASEIAKSSTELSVKLKELAIENSGQFIGGGVDPLIFMITAFILAAFVGYYIVWKVTPALHTPLMSITNAISGIIIISSMIAASSGVFTMSSALGYVATFFASINIFGGFIVTERMLAMFKNKKQNSK